MPLFAFADFSGPLRVVERVVVALRLVVTGGLPLPRRRPELVAALRSTVLGNLNSAQASQRKRSP